jgi:hypothetical protein
MTQLVLSGAPATQIRRGEDLIDVTLRARARGTRLALERWATCSSSRAAAR